MKELRAMAINSKFIRSSLSVTLIIGGLLTLVVIFDTGLKEGLSLAGGVAFSLFNIYFLWLIIRETITTKKTSGAIVAFWIFMKFIVLWGGFITLMRLNIIHPIFFVIGFTVLILIFGMKALNRWLIEHYQLEENDNGKDTEIIGKD